MNDCNYFKRLFSAAFSHLEVVKLETCWIRHYSVMGAFKWLNKVYEELNAAYNNGQISLCEFLELNKEYRKLSDSICEISEVDCFPEVSSSAIVINPCPESEQLIDNVSWEPLPDADTSIIAPAVQPEAKRAANPTAFRGLRLYSLLDKFRSITPQSTTTAQVATG